MYNADNEKREKTNSGRNRTNKEISRILEEMENYKYFRLLEVEIIKFAEIKGKKRKCSSNEQESLLKPNSAAEITSTG